MKIQKYNPTTKNTEGIDLRLSYLGYATVDTKWKSHQLATPFHRLYLIDKGSGELSAAGVTLALQPGKVYLLPADLPCSYHCDDTLSLLFFHFNITGANGVESFQNIHKPLVLDFSREDFDRLHCACSSAGCMSAMEIACGVGKILLDMSRQYNILWDNAPAYSPCVAQTLQQIHHNLSAQLRIDDLAEKRYLSRGYLARLFREEVGMTIKQYINMQLINTAQWKLSHTNESVENISAGLGFCNQFYFSQCFKKHCRVSPLQYRNGTKY